MRLLCVSFLALIPFGTWAQKTLSRHPDIKTVQVLLNGEAGRFPVMQMGSDDCVEVSFDHLTHEYERFEYRLVHCDRDWQPDGMPLGDYADYTQESIPIADYAYSFNTTQLYTHYAFTLPSDNLRPLVSGNYRIDIARDGDYEEGLMATACFMMAENAAKVSLNVTDNTEVDWKQTHQQVQMDVDYSPLQPTPFNPKEEITTIVLQNQRWDNARRAILPEQTAGNHMLWTHSRELVFKAGNEYRRFENTTTHHAAMGMESLRWYDPYYHAQLRLAEPRRHYVYDHDQNGLSLVRTIDGYDSDTEADYMYVHFELQMPPLPEGQHVYVQSHWSGDSLTPANELYYNASRGIYERAILLKQGYYDFQYLVTDSPSHPGRTAPVEGDFFQTENQYSVLVYYRNPFDRFDRLIGAGGI